MMRHTIRGNYSPIWVTTKVFIQAIFMKPESVEIILFGSYKFKVVKWHSFQSRLTFKQELRSWFEENARFPSTIIIKYKISLSKRMTELDELFMIISVERIRDV